MPSEPFGVLVRPGQPADGPVVGDLYVAARRAAVPSMPPSAHTEESMRAWIADQVAGEREAWVAEETGELLAFMLLEGGWLHSLYVRPDRTGEGIGTLLLDLAKTLRPDGLQLWVFESNVGARRLYERHGFVAVERTDGAGNEEKAPDVRMVWRGGGR
jgi:GNAT superfamily N-acetyltransferase